MESGDDRLEYVSNNELKQVGVPIFDTILLPTERYLPDKSEYMSSNCDTDLLQHSSRSIWFRCIRTSSYPLQNVFHVPQLYRYLERSCTLSINWHYFVKNIFMQCLIATWFQNCSSISKEFISKGIKLGIVQKFKGRILSLPRSFKRTFE